MITKAIVDDVSDKYEIKVRIPILDRASVDPRYVADAYLPSAPICTLPNTGLNLRKGDVVWVAFENGDQSRPVVVGCLYMDKVSETEASIILNSLSVSADAELPQNTTIGEVSSEELGYLKGLGSNVQAQIDEINNVIGGDVADVPVIKSNGRDSLVQKTVNIPEDVDTHGNPIDRTNIADGNFSGAFGSRNTVDSDSSETFAFGGKNKAYHTEDALIFGYDNETHYANQSIVGGYNNDVTASESAIFGENNTISGDISNNKTDVRKVLVMGTSNTVSHGTQWSVMYGEHNTAGGTLRHSIVGGSYNVVGDFVDAINVFGGGNGYSNQIKSYNSDITVFGYSNTVYGGTASNSRKGDDYILGHHNVVQDPSHTGRGLYDVYMVGNGLKSQHAHQVLLGEYNSSDSSESKDILTVGTGGGEDSRRTTFGVGYDSNHYIRIGSTVLTETQLQQLKNLLN